MRTYLAAIAIFIVSLTLSLTVSLPGDPPVRGLIRVNGVVSTTPPSSTTTIPPSSTVTTPPSATTAVATNPSANNVTLVMNLTGTINNPTLTKTGLFAGKTVAISWTKDDGGSGDWQLLYPLFWGGTAADGQTYPGLTYTDGAGGVLKPHVTFALNWNGGQTGNATSVAKHLEMVNVGFADVSNHSISHSGMENRYLDYWRNVVSIYNSLGYLPRTFTIPTSYEAFVKLSLTFGSPLVISQGYGPSGSSADDYQLYNPTQRAIYGEKVSVAETRELVATRRWFGDDWSTQDVTNVKTFFDQLLTASTGASDATTYTGFGFSHNVNWDTSKPGYQTQWTNFKDCVNYLYNHPNNNDRLWWCGMQEFLEYREIKRDLVVSKTVSGSTVTYVLDYSNVNNDVRHRNISFYATGGTIASITATGADKVTFNPQTGLVNVYKTKTTGFTDPSTATQPPFVVGVRTDPTDLTKLKVTLDKAVSFTGTGGFEVFTNYTGAPSARNPTALGTQLTTQSVTGSGTKELTIQLSGPMNLGTTFFDYRMQRGNARDATTNVLLTPFISMPVDFNVPEPTASQRRVVVVINDPPGTRWINTIRVNGTVQTARQYVFNVGDTVTISVTSTETGNGSPGKPYDNASQTFTVTSGSDPIIRTFNSIF
jgi:hypothetical protein